MQTDLREIGPTYYFAPPRVFETQLTNVMIRMEDSGPLKKWLFEIAIWTHAKKVGPDLLDGQAVARFADKLKYRLGELFVYGPLKNTLGSELGCGWAIPPARRLGRRSFDFYRSLGINLKQLYGQTEASVFITQQPDNEVRADTVGVPSPGVEMRIREKW